MGFSTKQLAPNNVDLDSNQTLENKTLDSSNSFSGDIVAPSRSDVKQDTLTNLQTYAATAANGQLVYATDAKAMYQIVDNKLTEISGGSGGLDVYYTEDMENFQNVSDFSTGNNAAFMGGGSLAGTLALETTTEIAGNQSLSYTQASGSLNDYFASEIITVENKQQNNDSGMTFYFTYDGDDNDGKFVVYDETNDTELTSGVELVKTQSGAKRYALSFYVPATCTQIRWGYQVLVENIGAELILDDVEITSNPFVYKNLEGSTKETTNFFGAQISNTGVVTEDAFDWISSVSYGSTTTINFTPNTFTVAPGIMIQLPDAFINLTSTIVPNGISISNTQVIINWREVSGSASAATAPPSGFRIEAKKVGVDYVKSTEHVITPAKSTLSDLVDFSSDITFSGFGGSETIDKAFYARSGEFADINIQVTLGAAPSGDMSLILPSYLPINTTKALLFDSNSVAARDTNTGGLYDGSVLVQSSSTISFRGDDGAITWNSTVPFTWASGDTIFIRLRVPIAEWTSDATFLAAIPTPKTVYIKDVKPSGTNGGTFTAGAWQTRDLNTLEGDTGFVSLSGNQFTLQSGKYEIDGFGTGYEGIGLNKTKLRDITNSSDVIIGTTVRSSASGVISIAPLKGQITITSSTTFELQHRSGATVASAGFGLAASFGVDEIYSQVKIRKIS